jgi:hypothetical protein
MHASCTCARRRSYRQVGTLSLPGGCRASALDASLCVVHLPNFGLLRIIAQVASVLKFNVSNEENGVKMDGHMRKMLGVMNKADGYVQTTRYVCKSEWAYELSFVFDSLDSFKAWKECELRHEVHDIYLKALEDCGIKEDDVYAGARVVDKLD